MKKHESFEENGLVYILEDEDDNMLSTEYTGELSNKFSPKLAYLCKLTDWQKATAKAIFELMPDIDKINKRYGKCFAVNSSKRNWGEDLSSTEIAIDVFPFSEYDEILREDCDKLEVEE